MIWWRWPKFAHFKTNWLYLEFVCMLQFAPMLYILFFEQLHASLLRMILRLFLFLNDFYFWYLQRYTRYVLVPQSETMSQSEWYAFVIDSFLLYFVLQSDVHDNLFYRLTRNRLCQAIDLAHSLFTTYTLLCFDMIAWFVNCKEI